MDQGGARPLQPGPGGVPNGVLAGDPASIVSDLLSPTPRRSAAGSKGGFSDPPSRCAVIFHREVGNFRLTIPDRWDLGASPRPGSVTASGLTAQAPPLYKLSEGLIKDAGFPYKYK